MNQFHLRIALLRAGYTPAPCHSGRPVVIPHGEVPESSILAWQNLNAPETGIYNQTTGEVTIVDAVPLTEAELAVQAEAPERARAEAHGAAERAERRSYKEAKRRAKGPPVRSKWLEEHHQDRRQSMGEIPASDEQGKVVSDRQANPRDWLWWKP